MRHFNNSLRDVLATAHLPLNHYNSHYQKWINKSSLYDIIYYVYSNAYRRYHQIHLQSYGHLQLHYEITSI